MKRSQKKYLRRCQEMCGGCAWRPGTDAWKARLRQSDHPLDQHLADDIERTLESGGATPFYCHEYGEEHPEGHFEIPEERMKLCVGWIGELRERHGIRPQRLG